MILSFSGDPFLAERAARRALGDEGLAPHEVLEMGEGMHPDEVRRAASQGGLFGRVGLLLDFDAAFHAQAGVKPRNEVIRVLREIAADVVVVVLDSGATPSRQRAYRELGRHVHLPTPRFERLAAWVRAELEAAGVRAARDVPDALADLFGEDLPAIVSEIGKLAVLDETLDAARVRAVANRPAARDAFDLIEAIARGDAAAALATLRTLLDGGESPQRIFGALGWQFLLVAKAVGLTERDGRVDGGRAAAELGARPFAARRALGIAAGLDEARVARILSALLAGDVRGKTGRDAAGALERVVIDLTDVLAPAAPRPGARASSGTP